MAKERTKTALLITWNSRDMPSNSSREALVLYESLTCDGSVGPSDIILLSRRGAPYSDREPTQANVEKAFMALASRPGGQKHCMVLLDGVFDEYSMGLSGGPMDLDLISALVESLDCGSTQLFLHGPGSDKAAAKLRAPGRTLAYSTRFDGDDKLEDPFKVACLFKGDEVHLTYIEKERARLLELGFELVWERT
jgi:hypothetical protein